jgi:HPt (histidine-containing phosphotransfer) domain-containing protein
MTNFWKSRRKRTPAVNRSDLGRLIGGDQAFLKTLTEIFREEWPQVFDKLRSAVELNQPEEMKKAAHALGGLVRSLAMQHAGTLAHALENADEGSKLDGPAALAALKAEIERGVAELQEIEMLPDPFGQDS